MRRRVDRRRLALGAAYGLPLVAFLALAPRPVLVAVASVAASLTLGGAALLGLRLLAERAGA